MENTLQIVIRIIDQTEKALNTAKANVQSFGKTASDTIKKYSDDIKAASLMATAFVGATALIGKQLADNAAQVEQNRIAFETMLGSQEKATTLLQQLSKFAMQTPFDLPQVVEGSQRLLAYNIEMQDVIPTFTMLGNIAAGVGREKLPNLILAFGQVKAATRLTGMELRQFTEAGVPLLDVLAKNFGKTSAEMKEMIEGGQVSFKDVQTALATLTGEGGKFHDLMSRQSKTLSGVLSNMRDEFFRTSLTIMGVTESGEIKKGGIFYYLKIGAQQMLAALQKARPYIENFMVFLVKNKLVIGAIIGLFVGLFTLIVAGFILVAGKAALIVAAVGAVGAVIGFLIGTLLTYLPQIISFFTGIYNSIVTTIQSIFTTVSAVFTGIWNTIIGIFTGVYNFVINTINGIITTVSNVFTTLVAVLTPIFEAIRGFFALLMGGLLVFIGFIFNILSFLLFGIIMPIFTAIFNFIFSIFQAIYNIVFSILNAIWSGIIQPVLTAIWNFFVSIFNTILNNVIIPIFTTASNFIKTTLNAVSSFVSTTLSSIWGFFSTHFNNIKGTVTSVFQSVYDWFIDKLTSLWNKVTDITTKIWDAFKNMANGITNALRSIKFPHLSIGEGSVTIAGKEIKFPKLNVDWYQQGGWVRNTGLAVVHAGEYVLSKDMLRGKTQPEVGVGNTINNYLYATVNTQVDLDYLAYKLAYMMRN